MALHTFYAVAFVENPSMHDLAAAFPGARVTLHELRLEAAEGGQIFAYSFGALVFVDMPPDRREAELARIHARLGLKAGVIHEEFNLREETEASVGLSEGRLVLDRLTVPRAGVVALTVAQSAAMEYYESLIEQLFARTNALVSPLEARGSVPMRTRPLNQFIGVAITARTEVLTVLHLLDKPDATWDDPMMDRIYGDLRAEFDLGDRYEALESKLRSVQETLELILGVVRDRRFALLELAIVALIVIELVLTVAKLR